MTNKETCANCGADLGIHHADTMQCPLYGVESYPKEQSWMTSTYLSTTNATAKIDILREALERIRDRKARLILPWTHEAAADEYAVMLDLDRTEATDALRAGKGEEGTPSTNRVLSEKEREYVSHLTPAPKPEVRSCETCKRGTHSCEYFGVCQHAEGDHPYWTPAPKTEEWLSNENDLIQALLEIYGIVELPIMPVNGIGAIRYIIHHILPDIRIKPAASDGKGE